MSPLRWNGLLSIVGLAIVEKRIGHWRAGVDGKLTRTTHVIGHRLTTARQARSMAPDETALDGFLRERGLAPVAALIAGINRLRRRAP